MNPFRSFEDFWNHYRKEEGLIGHVSEALLKQVALDAWKSARQYFRGSPAFLTEKVGEKS